MDNRGNHIDHIAFSHRWRGCIEDFHSHCSTLWDNERTLVLPGFVLRFSWLKSFEETTYHSQAE